MSDMSYSVYGNPSLFRHENLDDETSVSDLHGSKHGDRRLFFTWHHGPSGLLFGFRQKFSNSSGRILFILYEELDPSEMSNVALGIVDQNRHGRPWKSTFRRPRYQAIGPLEHKNRGSSNEREVELICRIPAFRRKQKIFPVAS